MAGKPRCRSRRRLIGAAAAAVIATAAAAPADGGIAAAAAAAGAAAVVDQVAAAAGAAAQAAKTEKASTRAFSSRGNSCLEAAQATAAWPSTGGWFMRLRMSLRRNGSRRPP